MAIPVCRLRHGNAASGNSYCGSPDCRRVNRFASTLSTGNINSKNSIT
jgi:hypothetical protein